MNVMMMVSPEEQLALEDQMRAQHYHPLSLSMKREEQRRQQRLDDFVLLETALLLSMKILVLSQRFR